MKKVDLFKEVKKKEKKKECKKDYVKDIATLSVATLGIAVGASILGDL